MKKIYEHQITNGNHAEAISVETDTKSVRIAVSDIEDMDSEEQTELITSIDLTPDGVVILIEALLQSINADDVLLFRLNGHQIKAIISSLELSMDVLDGEIEQEAMPYDLLERFKAKFDALIERDKQLKKDA